MAECSGVHFGTLQKVRELKIFLICAGVGLLGLLFGCTLAASAQQATNGLDDPGKIGHYAIGHTNYLLADQDAGGRPVAISVWYPVDANGVNSSPARYPLDPYSNNLPVTTSADWEKLGYDRAYEGPAPSNGGPFPLIMVSVARGGGDGGGSWAYIFIGTRLASHGYVVAVIDHYADGQWKWSPKDDPVTSVVNRTQDVSFAITELLGKSTTTGDLLYRTIDPQRIAMSGNSLGGYATYALAGGDDSVCDVLLAPPSNSASTCVPIYPDLRIKAMISLDGTSELLRYREMARISMPSLIMGETVENSQFLNGGPQDRDWIARPHAAISRHDSYRVDVNGSIHSSFNNSCDGFQVQFNLGLISSDDLKAYMSSSHCTNLGPDPATISAADAHQVVTKYMIAFLNTYLGHTNTDSSILTPDYALTHTPVVQFFDNETCSAAVPDDSWFSYRPHQVTSECEVALKDPGWFTAQAPLATENSASLGFAPLAPDEITYSEAPGIASALYVAPGNSLPTTLGGVTLEITDSQGQKRLAPLYYVTTNAVCYLIPPGTALGPATGKLTTSTGATIPGTFTVDRVSPGLFTANGNGSGVPAGFWIRVAADGAQTYDFLFGPAQPAGSRVPVPVDLGASTDQVFLSLYGTGFRGATQGTATVGGMTVPAVFAAVGVYQGEDVVKIGPLPRSLAGRGEVGIELTFDGKIANTVQVSIR